MYHTVFTLNSQKFVKNDVRLLLRPFNFKNLHFHLFNVTDNCFEIIETVLSCRPSL